MAHFARIAACSLVLAAYSTCAKADLIAWYNFSDSSNPAVVADNSGHGHVGTVAGGAAYAAPGANNKPAFINGAMQFGGGTDAVLTDVNGTSDPFSLLTAHNAGTVGLWIYGDASQPQAQVAFWADDGTGNRQFQAHTPWSDQTIYFDTGGCCSGDTRLAMNDPNSADWKGQWNQWTFVKNGNDKAIYVNGTLFDSQTGSATAPIGTIGAFNVGNATGSNQTNGYHGQIGDFAVFDSGLTPDQVNQLVTRGAQSFVPEPASATLLGLGAVACGLLGYRRRRAASA